MGAVSQINMSAGWIYLTKELNFPKESLSFLSFISAPSSIIVSLLSSYVSKDKPFKVLAYMYLASIFINNYHIFVILRTFPTKVEDQTSFWNLAHLGTFNFLSDVIMSFRMVTFYSIVFKIADKRISGIHITLLASLSNMCFMGHKFYIYKVVEMFDIWIPQAVISVVVIVVWLYGKDRIIELDDAPNKSWHINDDIVNKIKLQIKDKEKVD